MRMMIYMHPEEIRAIDQARGLASRSSWVAFVVRRQLEVGGQVAPGQPLPVALTIEKRRMPKVRSGGGGRPPTPLPRTPFGDAP
jgi:hypothetical protein